MTLITADASQKGSYDFIFIDWTAFLISSG
jgi:hypothetical protein